MLPHLLKVNGIARPFWGLCTHFCKQFTTCTAGHNAVVSGTCTTHLFQTNMLGCLTVFAGVIMWTKASYEYNFDHYLSKW